MAKQWVCRRRDWPEDASPYKWNHQEYRDFESRSRAAGDWDWWLCGVQPGEATFSRDVQNAQRAMNLSAPRPADAPTVPETGRYNWEMLEYAKCGIARDIASARDEYKGELAFRLATLLQEDISEERIQHDVDSALAELGPRAKASRLLTPDTSCSPPAGDMYDLALCRMKRRDGLLNTAEGLYKAYADRVASLRDSLVISGSQAAGIARDVELVREYL